MGKGLLNPLERVADRLKPELVFLVLAMVFGLGLVFVNAPFEAPDEAAHFWRTYHVYEGNFLSTRQGNSVGGWIPVSVATAHLPFEPLVNNPENRVDRQAFSKGLHEPFDPENKCFMALLFPALYSPVVYVPQVIGIAVGRLCGQSALKLMYAGRIANLLCWIIAMYFAIRIMPVFKWVLVLVALLPMSLSQAASLSADGPTNAMAMLLTALVFRAVLDKDADFGKWTAIAVILLCVLLSMAKQAYAPLTGLVLMIPAERFKGLRGKLLFCGGSIGSAFLATMLWSMAIKELYTPFHGANAPEQMSWLMAHPWAFPGIVFNTWLAQWRGYVVAFIGKLGFLDTYLPWWIYYSYPFVLLAAAFIDKGSGSRLGWLQRCWIGMLCVGVFLLVVLSMYLTWTPPGASVVEGVQGRYFLPIAVPAFLALCYNRKVGSAIQSLIPPVATVYSVAVLITTCIWVYFRFFGQVG